MKTPVTLLAVALALTGASGPLGAQTAQSTEPIEVAKLPYIEIFSPTFFWNDEADFVRTGSTRARETKPLRRTTTCSSRISSRFRCSFGRWSAP